VQKLTETPTSYLCCLSLLLGWEHLTINFGTYDIVTNFNLCRLAAATILNFTEFRK